MQTFRIGEDGIKELKKKMLSRIIPVILIIITGGIAINIVNSKEKMSGVFAIPFIIVFLAVAFGRGIYGAIKKQKALLQSYTLTVTNNMITREQLDTPTVSIYFNDISEIIKNTNGNFLIRGKDPVDFITIPAQINDHAGLEVILNQIRPVIEKKASFFETNLLLSSVVVIGLMICVYVVRNKFVVGTGGTAIAGLLIWSFVKIQMSRNVDRKTKRSSWWLLIVLVSTIMVMIMKLTDGI